MKAFEFCSLLFILISFSLSLPHYSSNSLNKFIIPQSNKNWMSKIANTTNITNLAIPGTQDSCAYEFFGGYFDSNDYDQTQSWTLKEQLYVGIRFFEFLIEKNGWIYTEKRSTNSTLLSVFQQFVSFLSTFPTEGIIVKLSCRPLNNKQACLSTNIFDVLEKYRHKLLLIEEIPLLHQMRGKIFLIVENIYCINCFNWNNGKITLQNSYENIGLKEKRMRVLNYIEISRKFSSLFIINYVSSSKEGNNLSIKEFALEVNSILLEEKNYTGIFPLNYPGEELITHIIKQNEKFIQKEIILYHSNIFEYIVKILLSVIIFIMIIAFIKLLFINNKKILNEENNALYSLRTVGEKVDPKEKEKIEKPIDLENHKEQLLEYFGNFIKRQFDKSILNNYKFFMFCFIILNYL